MEYIFSTIFSVHFKVWMNTDFERDSIYAIAFNFGEPTANTLSSLHMMKCLCYHNFWILPQNPHYTSSCE